MNLKKRGEVPTSYAILLVAFPELEKMSFGDWTRQTVGVVLNPVFRGLENILADLADLARYFTHRS